MNSLQTQAGLNSVMKTASKAQRVPADINEDSPAPVRVLRNGKRVPRATPRLPRASRVELSPEGPKTLPRAHRVPVCQVTLAASSAIPPKTHSAELCNQSLSIHMQYRHLMSCTCLGSCVKYAIQAAAWQTLPR